MKIDGQCYCGDIRFEAEADPAQTVMCNCTDCQAMTGSAFRVTIPTQTGSFRLLSGEPTLFVKITSSGAQRLHAFCPRCGSPIYVTPVGDGRSTYNLRFGTVRQREHFRPGVQIWARSQPAWVNEIAAIPAFEGPR